MLAHEEALDEAIEIQPRAAGHVTSRSGLLAMTWVHSRAAHPTVGFISTWPLYQGTTIDRHAHALVKGICAAARDHSCGLLIGAGVSTVSDRASWRTAWPVPIPEADFVPVGQWNCDGLIIVSDDLSASHAAHARDMQAAGLPVVFTTPEGPGARVVVDNKGGIRAAVTHLLKHGHREIAFIAGTHYQGGDSAERLRTFRDVLEEHGVSMDERLIAHGEHRHEGGYLAMRRILASGRHFTALAASNDLSCLGAMRALREAGYRVPQDVAAIGFDDILDARSSTPSLTTVRHPTYQLGYAALTTLLGRLAGASDTDRVVVPTRLIRRESCGCQRHDLGEHSEEGNCAAGDLGSLAREMAEAAFTEAQHTSIEQFSEQSRELISALMESAHAGDDRLLREMLASILSLTGERGEDVHAWQAAISVIYRRSDRLPDETAGIDHALFMELLDEARLAVSEEAQRSTTRTLLGHVDMMSELGLLTAQLNATPDVNRSREILSSQLPRLGIEHLLVALCRGGEEDPLAESEVLLAMGLDGANGLRFASRLFPPSEVYPRDEPVQLLLLPLQIDEATYGFASLPASALEPAAAIVGNLATALRASWLYRDALEGRRLAEQAAHLKSRFLSMVSHELRTPLSVVVGLSDMLLREVRHAERLSPAAVRDLERLSASAQHLGQLIGDVLDLASSEAGQLRLVRQSVDLTELVSELSAVGQQMARDKRIRWRLEVPEEPVLVLGDRTRLRQVVLNLIANAVKYSDRGEVALRLAADPAAAVIRVADTGPGISADEQDRIFDEFYRSPAIAATGSGSLGLGLAIARQLVELQGGEITVESPGPAGRGSVFCVTLPLLVEREQTKPGAEEPRSVLIFSERPRRAHALAGHLRAKGIGVLLVAVRPGDDLARHVVANLPAAVILEGELASRPGWQLVQTLRDSQGFEDVAVFAWNSEQESGRSGMLELDYLCKPLQIADLAQRLQAELDGSASNGQPLVLVVDDDPDLRELHGRLVQQAGGRALMAADGDEALALLGLERPELVLLDLVMPGRDGFAVLEAIRASPATREVPVIVVTGRDLSETDLDSLNQGVTGILNKGLFTAAEICARVEQVLARQQALGAGTQQLVRRACAFIQAHYTDTITRDDIARHVGMSPDYLTDCFRRELGVTPMVYLNRWRIREAKSLLDRTSLPVTDIALRVGFSDLSHFTRMFHREVGVSPRAFRLGQLTLSGQRGVVSRGTAER
jgi:signal transduction histidine kinase/DNA-binding response OmpR family regulator/ABC-type sugar transport system substrate-binding protein